MKLHEGIVLPIALLKVLKEGFLQMSNTDTFIQYLQCLRCYLRVVRSALLALKNRIPPGQTEEATTLVESMRANELQMDVVSYGGSNTETRTEGEPWWNHGENHAVLKQDLKKSWHFLEDSMWMAEPWVVMNFSQYQTGGQ